MSPRCKTRSGRVKPSLGDFNTWRVNVRRCGSIQNPYTTSTVPIDSTTIHNGNGSNAKGTRHSANKNVGGFAGPNDLPARGSSANTIQSPRKNPNSPSAWYGSKRA